MSLRAKFELGMALKSNGNASFGLMCSLPIMPVRYPACLSVFTTLGILPEYIEYSHVARPIWPFWCGYNPVKKAARDCEQPACGT